MNITLWSLVALMVLIALVIIIPPLWRREGTRGLSRRATNIGIYRERVAELEAEHRNGRLDAEQLRGQKEELGRRLLHESQSQSEKDDVRASHARPWWISGLLMLCVPVMAFTLYWSAGTWRTPTQEPDLPYLVQRLEQRLAEAPEDAQAWELLGRARRAMGENATAAQAFKQANVLAQEPSAALLLLEVEASTMAANGDLTGRPKNLLSQVLIIEPQNIEALWLSGLAARQSGELSAARKYWKQLLGQELPPEFANTVKSQLQRLPQS